MDQHHCGTIVYAEPSYAAFYPSGFMGDAESLSIEPAYSERPHCGRTSLRIEYSPKKYPSERWAGIYFSYPSYPFVKNGNWGEHPGRPVSGATRLTLWARSDRERTITLVSGGINLPPQPGFQYSDSFKYKSVCRLSRQWAPCTIEFDKELDDKSVIGAFAFSIRSDFFRSTTEPHDVIFLDDVMFNDDKLDEPRFVQSYLPLSYKPVGNRDGGKAPSNIAHTYDQALVLLAFLARGNEEDRRRAKLIADAFVLALENDRMFKREKARLRNGYASGDLIDPASGHTRLPGSFNENENMYFEDAFATGTLTGNMAWAGLALVQTHFILSSERDDKYLHAALKIGNWIIQNTMIPGEPYGFRGGFKNYDGAFVDLNWRSTEHNIDLVAFFDLLASAIGKNTREGRAWLERKAHAERFVESMWHKTESGDFLWTGTLDTTPRANTNVIPLDPQTWSVLGIQSEQYEPALDWALAHCRDSDKRGGYDFNCLDGDGTWWEGTAQVAAALKWLGRDQEAMPMLRKLRQAQIRKSYGYGALPAASIKRLSTGFSEDPTSREGDTYEVVYTNDPHIGATAWYIFSELGKNPFDLRARQQK